jgi:hypothetical protein
MSFNNDDGDFSSGGIAVVVVSLSPPLPPLLHGILSAFLAAIRCKCRAIDEGVNMGWVLKAARTVGWIPM